MNDELRNEEVDPDEERQHADRDKVGEGKDGEPVPPEQELVDAREERPVLDQPETPKRPAGDPANDQREVNEDEEGEDAQDSGDQTHDEVGPGSYEPGSSVPEGPRGTDSVDEHVEENG